MYGSSIGLHRRLQLEKLQPQPLRNIRRDRELAQASDLLSQLFPPFVRPPTLPIHRKTHARAVQHS